MIEKEKDTKNKKRERKKEKVYKTKGIFNKGKNLRKYLMCVYVLHCALEDVDKCTSGFIRHTVNNTIMRSLDRLFDEAINILFSVVQVHSMNHAFDKSLC